MSAIHRLALRPRWQARVPRPCRGGGRHQGSPSPCGAAEDGEYSLPGAALLFEGIFSEGETRLVCAIGYFLFFAKGQSSAASSSNAITPPAEVNVMKKVGRKRTREERKIEPLRQHRDFGFKLKVAEYADAFGVIAFL